MSKRLLIYSKTTIASRLHHTHTRRLCTLGVGQYMGKPSNLF